MAMQYANTAISEVPQAARALFQHVLDTYASECNKVISTWLGFAPADMDFRPHPRSSSVQEVMKHELLSGRRFFAEFLAVPEPPPAEVLPAESTPQAFADRMRQLALPRLHHLAPVAESWWLERVSFFDVERERIWIFWRRVLHSAHHRTQLTVYLRLLNKPVPAIYGPTADVSWEGADPTQSMDAAGRK